MYGSLFATLLTASQPAGATMAPTYEQVCLTIYGWGRMSCGLARQDFDPDGRVEFYVTEAALPDMLSLPWDPDLPVPTIEVISDAVYQDRLDRSTVGGALFDFRGDMEVTTWGETRQAGVPEDLWIDTGNGTVQADGGEPMAPGPFVDSRLMAGNSECAMGVIGGFMKGAMEGGAAGAGVGATLGALASGVGALPGALAGGTLLGAWGAIAGALEGGADHCGGSGGEGQEGGAGGQDGTETGGQGGQEGEGSGTEQGGDTGGGGGQDEGGQEGGTDQGGGGSGSGDDAPSPESGTDGTPDPLDGPVTEEGQEAADTLGVGQHPLGPDPVDTLVDPDEETGEARVRLTTHPMESPLGDLILHDGIIGASDWLDGWLGRPDPIHTPVAPPMDPPEVVGRRW